MAGDPQRSVDEIGEQLRDVLVAYRIPIGILIAAIAYSRATGQTPIQSFVRNVAGALPPGWGLAAQYAAIGAVPGLVGALIINSWYTDRYGVRVLELAPLSDRRRDVRVGEDLWQRCRFVDVRGQDVDPGAVDDIDVNGEPAKEVVLIDEESETVVATWLGRASTAELRSFQSMVIYVERVLSAEVDEAQDLRANFRLIARRVGHEFINHIIRVEEGQLPTDGSDADAMPRVDELIDDVLADLDVEADPLTGGDGGVDVDVEDPRDALLDAADQDLSDDEVEIDVDGDGEQQLVAAEVVDDGGSD